MLQKFSHFISVKIRRSLHLWPYEAQISFYSYNIKSFQRNHSNGNNMHPSYIEHMMWRCSSMNLFVSILLHFKASSREMKKISRVTKKKSLKNHEIFSYSRELDNRPA